MDDRQAQIEAFLATRGARRCPATTSHKDNARSLREWRNDHESRCAGGDSTDSTTYRVVWVSGVGEVAVNEDGEPV